jgi:hypothetical protein
MSWWEGRGGEGRGNGGWRDRMGAGHARMVGRSGLGLRMGMGMGYGAVTHGAYADCYE